jgi:hypothetical protein
VLVSSIFSNAVLLSALGDLELYGSLEFVFWADAFCLIATYILLLPEVWPRRGRPRAQAADSGTQMAGQRGTTAASKPLALQDVAKGYLPDSACEFPPELTLNRMLASSQPRCRAGLDHCTRKSITKMARIHTPSRSAIL